MTENFTDSTAAGRDGTRMSAAGAAGTNEAAAAQRREAARALEMIPILTAAKHPDELALIRRHAPALKQSFQTVLGYPLVIEASFARLTKPPLPADVEPRGAVRANNTPLSPRAYTFLALVCAGFLAPGTGEQVVMSALVEQVRSDAATAGIDVDDTITDRRALVAAIGHLTDVGLLVETDGSVAAWGERHEEALLSINRALLPHILACSLAGLTEPHEVWEPAEDAADPQPRRTLRRRLVENPLTRREHLTDAEADALSRERRDIGRALDDAFGLTLEVRLEGALAYDPDQDLTDIAFPGQGTVSQAALLLIDALVDNHKPGASTTALVDGNPVPGLLCAWDDVDAELDDLISRNVRSWRAGVAEDPEGLRNDVVARLRAVGLAIATDTGLVLHPACARYRPEPVRTPTRARTTRPAADDAPDTANDDPDLFDPDPSDPDLVATDTPGSNTS